MYIVIGLGNPEEQYKMTRHNTGRIILELLVKKHKFSAWKEDIKMKALISKGEIDGEKFMFFLPNNFMNNSGKSVAPLFNSLLKTNTVLARKMLLEKLVVVYDDMDLPMDSLKISFNRSSGGHNGLESIIKSLKSQEFSRIRVGISPATSKGLAKKPNGEDKVVNFLLKNFKQQELDQLKKISKRVELALVTLSAQGRLKAMSICN